MESIEQNNDFFGENQMFLTENEFPFETAFDPSFPESADPTTVVVKSEVPEEMPEETPLQDVVSEEPILTAETTDALPVTEPPVEEQYTVEAIVGKRRRNQRIEYCVKWLGFDDSENTWEPIDNLNCQELIAEFEAQQSTPARRGRKAAPKSTPKRKTTPTTTTATPRGDGFSRGLKAKKVIGVSEERGQLFYSVEWVGEQEASLVAGKVARAQCPQLVIQFLQSKLTFNRKRPKEPLENYRPIASKNFSLFSDK